MNIRTKAAVLPVYIFPWAKGKWFFWTTAGKWKALLGGLCLSSNAPQEIGFFVELPADGNARSFGLLSFCFLAEGP